VKRDSIFYKIFQQSPSLLFELVEQARSLVLQGVNSGRVQMTVSTPISPAIQPYLNLRRCVLVLRLLNRRFSKISKPLLSKIETLSLEQTEALSEAVLDFTTIADLKTWLQNNT